MSIRNEQQDEKKIIDLLTNELAENIFDELIMRMNDL